MNLPNKITIFRIILSIIIIIILLAPFDALGINFPMLFVNESIVVDFKYIVVGVIFVLASISDFLDGYIARKYNMVTDFGKMIDAIADKILVNSVLVILCAQGFVHPIIPVVVILRDSIVNTIKMSAGNCGNVVAASMLGKIKTIFMMVGITLTLFYNLPFELWNLRVSDILLIVSAILSVVSGVEYYNKYKKYLKI